MTWARVSLREIGRWYGGGTPSKANSSFWKNGTIPWVSPKDMGAHVLTDSQDHVTPAALDGSSTRLVPAGSVAVVTRSGILERTLPIALVPFETTLNQDMKAVVPHEGIDVRWVAWGLRALERALLRETRKAGTTVASIEMPRFYAFALPVPPLEEQRRILDIIEDHLSRLDAAGTYLTGIEARSEVLRERFLTEAISDVESPEVSLVELLTTSLVNGRSVPTSDRGFPVLRLTALRDGRIDLAERKSGAWEAEDARRFLVRRGDFLIARGNGSLRLVGRGGLVVDDPDPVAFPDTLIRARPDTQRILPDYLALVWNDRAVRRQIEMAARTTAGIYKVNQKDLGAVRIPLPSLSDQRRIVTAVGNSRSSLDKLADDVRVAARRSAVLRRSILDAAFSGRLTGGKAAEVDEVARA